MGLEKGGFKRFIFVDEFGEVVEEFEGLVVDVDGGGGVGDGDVGGGGLLELVEGGEGFVEGGCEVVYCEGFGCGKSCEMGVCDGKSCGMGVCDGL